MDKKKRVRAVQTRRKFWIKAAAMAVLLLSASAAVRWKKDALIREGAAFLQNLLSRETQFDIRIGDISGKLTGSIRFSDVRVEDPAKPAATRTLFRAEEVEFQYRLLDFIAKKFASKIDVIVKSPELRWRPKVELTPDRFAWLAWLRKAMLERGSPLRIHLRNLTVFAGEDEVPWRGIEAELEGAHLDLQIPVRHLAWGENDVSTQLHLIGRLEAGVLPSQDAWIGQIFTEGTVVNWKPLPWESHVDFVLTRSSLRLDTANLFGGFEFNGEAQFERDIDIDFTLKAESYPLSNFEPFLGPAVGALEGKLDFMARVDGPLDSPNTAAHVRLVAGRTGRKKFQVMNLHMSGIYPTLQLSNSHIVMEDGSVMHFADQAVEVRDLFSSRTYRRLVGLPNQEVITYGDWQFSSPEDENREREFRVGRSLGKRAKLHFRKYNEPAQAIFEPFKVDEKQDMELGFEYRLRGRDSLRLNVREDEQFVGVERKLSF